MVDALQFSDQLIYSYRFQEALDVLLSQEDQSDPNILWRKASVMHKFAKTTTDKEKHEEYIRTGFEFIEEALKKDDNNYSIHNWYAILLNEHALLSGSQAQAAVLVDVHRHLIRATELNPDDYTVWHSLGVMEYSLADLPWYYKKYLSIAFPNLQKGTYEKALECLQKAESIQPNLYSVNNLMLGKAHLQLKDRVRAKEQFNFVINGKVRSIFDENAKAEAEKLIKKL